MFKDTPWHLCPRKKILRIVMATTNTYENLEDDELDEYGDYTTPWKLDCAATSTFAGKHTGILKRKKVTDGFDVMVANGETIKQIKEGIVPFDVPAAAAHVAVFKNMPNALLAAGPLVKAGCYIVLDTPQAKVINKKTGKVILISNLECLSLSIETKTTGTGPAPSKQRLQN